jgi:hypothetical protein
MELPDDIVYVIKEYAQPRTRPDWRYMHKMTKCDLYSELLNFEYIEPDQYHNGIVKIRNIWVEFNETGFEVL